MEPKKGDGGGVSGPWKCVANVGYSPTFAGQENAEKIVEGHLIGYEGDACARSIAWYELFLYDVCIPKLFIFHHFYLQAQFAGGFTLRELLDRPCS